ncbi:hypothetical protein Mgra_00001133 [Meloidogyne graminicola]|uniref:Uncharacterized protein n=1 Tax=Meloidogyne graminicola TaxID=189291 RepID=A0A8T0A2C9_9BILA|nr:hypothetical protein Mgra_00001133 [Meloidogyne graminicola]
MSFCFNNTTKCNEIDLRNKPESSPPEIDCLLPDASTSQNSPDVRGPVAFTNAQIWLVLRPFFFRAPKPLTPVVRPVLPDQICLNSELSKFHKPSSAAIKKQLAQLKAKLAEVPNVDWKRHIDHLISLTIQQQSDIDLLRSCSIAYEQWASIQLKKFGALLCDHANLSVQKKKMEEQEGLGKIEVLEKDKKRLEDEANDLKLVKDKYNELLKEVDRLKTDLEASQKKNVELTEEKEKLFKINDSAKTLPKIEAERNLLKKQLEDLQNKENEKIKELEEKNNLAQKRIKILLTEFRSEEEKKVAELEEKLAKERKLRVAADKTLRYFYRNVPPNDNTELKEGLSRSLKRELSVRDAEINRLKVDIAAKAEEILEAKSKIDEAKHATMELRAKFTRKRDEAQIAKTELKAEKEQREFLEKRIGDLEEELLKYRSKTSNETQNLGPLKTTATTTIPSTKEIKFRIREICNKKNLMEKSIDLFADKQCGKCLALKQELAAVQLKLSNSVQRKKDKDASSSKTETEKSDGQKQEEKIDKQIPNTTDEQTEHVPSSLKRSAPPENISEPPKKRTKKRKTSELQQKECHQTPPPTKNSGNGPNTFNKPSVSTELTEQQKSALPSSKQSKPCETQKNVQESPLPSTNNQKTCEPKNDVQQTPLPSKNVKKSTTIQKSVEQPSTSIAEQQQSPVIQKVDTTALLQEFDEMPTK